MLLQRSHKQREEIGKEEVSLSTAQLSKAQEGLFFKAVYARACQHNRLSWRRRKGRLSPAGQKSPLSAWHNTTDPTSCCSFLPIKETKDQKWNDGRQSRFRSSKKGSCGQGFRFEC